jgi:hypothetical protein
MSLNNCKVVGANAEYRENAGKRGDKAYEMSRSEIRLFAECPAKWIAGFEPEPTAAMKWGTALDALVLTPDGFHTRFVVSPDTYPAKEGPKPWNRNATFCKEWEAGQTGKTVLKPEQMEDLNRAASTLMADDAVRDLIKSSKCQVAISAEWQDNSGIAIPLKGLIDIVPDKDHPVFGKSLADLKTVASASERDWTRDIANYGLDMQGALYLDIYVAATGEDRVDFRHPIQEQEWPYHVEKRILSQEFINLGRMKYQAALAAYCQCLQTNMWPGYPVHGISLDGWILTEPAPWMILEGPQAAPIDKPTISQSDEGITP